jgi:hypothetical protein
MGPKTFDEELQAAQELPDEFWKVERLADLAQRAPAAQQTDVWLEALTLARSVHSYDRDHLRKYVVERLPADLPLDALADALFEAQQLTHDYERAEAVAAVAARWPAAERQVLFDEALATARQSEAAEAASLRKLFRDRREAAFLSDILAVSPRMKRVEALSGVAAYLPPGQQEPVFEEALAAARELPAENRVAALGEVVVHLPVEQREPVLAEALATAQTIAEERGRAWRLVSLFKETRPKLPAVQLRPVLIDALTAAAEVEPIALTLFRDLRGGCDPEFLADALGEDLPADWLPRYARLWEQKLRAFRRHLSFHWDDDDEFHRYREESDRYDGRLAELLAELGSHLRRVHAWVGGMPPAGWPSRRRRVLPAVDEVVQAALAETVPGRVAFNPPSTMRQGTTAAMEVRIIRSQEMDDAITTSLRGRAVPRLADISTSLVMAVDLIGEAFTITAYSSREQLVLASEPTSWKFDLRTSRTGEHGLAVRVSMRLPVDDQDRCHDVCVLERTVRVLVSPSYFVREHWKWLVATAIPVGGAVAAWKGIF